MYFLLGLSIMLAAMLVINSIATLSISVCWKLFQSRIGRTSAANRARTLFLLRISPALVALIAVLVLFAPAYLIHEPKKGHEAVSVNLAVLALIAGLGIFLALIRTFATWRATARLSRNWRQLAEPLNLGLNVPAYRFEHRFPLIAVIGTIRPRLFVAQQVFESLTRDELAAALEHEAGHLAARDNLKRSLMRVCKDLLLFAPGSSKLDQAWLEASESAADDFASRADGRKSLDLASALVKIARLIPAGARPTMPAGAFLIGEQEGACEFNGRVRRLLATPKYVRTDNPSRRIHRWVEVGFSLIALALVANHPQTLAKIHLLIEHGVRLLG